MVKTLDFYPLPPGKHWVPLQYRWNQCESVAASGRAPGQNFFRFEILDFKNTTRDLEIWIRGHSRSSKLVPFNRFIMLSN